MEMIKKIIYFIKHDVWGIPLKSLPKQQSFLLKQLRIFLLAIRGFNEDKIQLRASALTFFTLLSIVPVVAMAFGISKGFGLERKLQEQLTTLFAGHEDIMENVIAFAHNMLSNTKGGLITGIGFIILIYSVMKLLSSIEGAFNNIWQIKKPRVFIRKLTDYISLMLIAPILIILSSSITVYVTAQITQIAQEVSLIGFFNPLIQILIKLLPFCIIWLLFTLIYIIMPNTKVNFSSAFVAGIIAGSIFQFTQWGYVHFQIGVSKYNAIYGSFAAFPLFLIWLQFSWLIVLFGAEISFANQNVEKYEYETESLNISPNYKRMLTLLVSHLIIKNFEEGKKPFTATDIAHELEIPIRLIREIIYDLTECNILSETVTKNPKERAYQPAQDINRLTIKHIIDTIESNGSSNLKVKRTKELAQITELMNAFNNTVKKLPENKLLKDLV